MESVVSVIRNTVPINQFNRGLAGRIFEDVKKTGTKVVIKNNQPECVLMSPDEYLELIDELEDVKLLATAEERISRFDPEKLISLEEMEKRFEISTEDLEKIGVFHARIFLKELP